MWKLIFEDKYPHLLIWLLGAIPNKVNSNTYNDRGQVSVHKYIFTAAYLLHGILTSFKSLSCTSVISLVYLGVRFEHFFGDDRFDFKLSPKISLRRF